MNRGGNGSAGDDGGDETNGATGESHVPDEGSHAPDDGLDTVSTGSHVSDGSDESPTADHGPYVTDGGDERPHDSNETVSGESVSYDEHPQTTDDTLDTRHRRLARWRGVFAIGRKRAFSRASYTARQRVLFSILGVAIAIGLVVIVTGIGVGLATGTTVYDDDIDYWIVPDGESAHSPLVATANPQFGSAHDATAIIRDIDDVDAVSPVLAQPMLVESEDESEFLLVIGIIPADGVDRIGGVTVTDMTHGDPYYGDGNYDGEWTGEVVLSNGAAAYLDVSDGDAVAIGGEEDFHVVGVDDGSSSVGNVPTAVVQLSELQTLVGADAYDQADQFVVSTGTPAIQSDLEAVYDESVVVSRGEMTARETIDSDLPLALSLTAFLVAVIVGTLFVVTTAGLELVADSTQLATMSAIGLSTTTQLQLTGVQTLVTTGIGGVLGGLFGLGGIVVVNYAAMELLTSEPIALFHLLFLPYGIVTALLIGVLSLPYLLFVTKRVSGGVPQ